MRAESPKERMEAVPGEGNDAVGVPGGERHWYVAIVGNNSERLCGERLEARVADRPPEARAYEVYVPTQEETRVLPSGRRKRVERVVFRAMVFIRCTERTRRREIVYLPYIKRFMVDITGGTSGGPRPVAVIPDIQMARLRRMLDGSEEPVLIDTRPLPLGARVRINGGKLNGLEGHVLETADDVYFVIRVDLLGCAKMRVARDLLDLID